MIIIKYFESFALKVPGAPDAYPRWAKVDVGRYKENYKYVGRLRLKQIDRDEAMRLIDENGLVEVMSNRYGKVFDTPDQSFRKKNKGIPVSTVLGE